MKKTFAALQKRERFGGIAAAFFLVAILSGAPAAHAVTFTPTFTPLPGNKDTFNAQAIFSATFNAPTYYPGSAMQITGQLPVSASCSNGNLYAPIKTKFNGAIVAAQNSCEFSTFTLCKNIVCLPPSQSGGGGGAFVPWLVSKAYAEGGNGPLGPCNDYNGATNLSCASGYKTISVCSYTDVISALNLVDHTPGGLGGAGYNVQTGQLSGFAFSLGYAYAPVYNRASNYTYNGTAASAVGTNNISTVFSICDVPGANGCMWNNYSGSMPYTVIPNVPVIPVVNGACTASHYSCAQGNVGATAEYATDWEWWCNGSGGGINTLCAQLKPTTCTNGATNWPACNACTSPLVWNGSSCVACSGACTNGNCNNGGNNPPSCNACTSPLVWNGIGCIVCSNGGCTNGICNNGANNPSSCNACTAPLAWNGSSCVACSGGCGSGGTCNNGATNPPSCNTCSLSQFWNGGGCVACNGGCSNGSCVNGGTNPPTCTPKPAISSFTAGASQIIFGQSTTLSWTAANAASCSSASTGFNTGSGSPTSGTSAITPTSSGANTYQINCTGAGGTTSAWVTVTAFLPTASITVSPTRVLKGNPITVSGNAAAVTACAVLKNGVPLGATTSSDGSHLWTPAAAIFDVPVTLSAYWLSCSGYPDSTVYVLSAVQTVNISATGLTEF